MLRLYLPTRLWQGDEGTASGGEVQVLHFARHSERRGSWFLLGGGCEYLLILPCREKEGHLITAPSVASTDTEGVASIPLTSDQSLYAPLGFL